MTDVDRESQWVNFSFLLLEATVLGKYLSVQTNVVTFQESFLSGFIDLNLKIQE